MFRDYTLYYLMGIIIIALLLLWYFGSTPTAEPGV